LLIAGKYEEVKRMIGAGKAVERPTLKPLSPEAIVSRLPSPPEDLVGALQDPIHREVGRYRPAKNTRSRKRSGGQSEDQFQQQVDAALQEWCQEDYGADKHFISQSP
jgi:hypothetical protein